MSVQDLALQRNKYKHLSDTEWRWFLQQVEGRERTAEKLPTFAAIEDWWYPVKLSCEQCSSELTARYKAEIIGSQINQIDQNKQKLLDLTGGYGVDTFFLSELFAHTDYVEQNTELCRIMEHNKEIKNEKLKIKNICVHNCTAEEFLTSHNGESKEGYDLIFLDPARRDSHGGKVFKLADCTPNVVELLPTLMEHLAENGQIMLKLSPMLDISQAIKELQAPPHLPKGEEITWDVHVVAVKNEVKEVLLVSTRGQSTKDKGGTITAIDLAEPEKAFVFTREEEKEAAVNYQTLSINYLYEPSASILKAGAYKLISQRFYLRKLDPNTHLYASETYVENFPGRVWQIKETIHHTSKITIANVLVRNYPLTAEQLKKKMRLKDGGTEYIIGCRVKGKPTIFYAERVLAVTLQPKFE